MANIEQLRNQIQHKFALKPRQIAKELGVEEDSYEVDEQVTKREGEIEDLQRMLYTVENCVGKEHWHHLNNLADDKDEAFKTLSESAAATVNIDAERYFLHSNMRLNEVDWLYVDLLIALTYKKMYTEGAVNIANISMPGYMNGVELIADGKYVQFSIKLLWWLAKWLMLLILLAVLFFNEGSNQAMYTAIGVGIVGYLIFARYKKRKLCTNLIVELQQKLAPIKKAYALTATANIHYDVLRKEIDDASSKGIEWLSSLYTATKQTQPHTTTVSS